MTHRVTVLAHEGLAPFELGVAAEVFALPRPELGIDPWYAFSVCAERPGVLPAMGGFGLSVERGLEELRSADTIVIPGSPDVHGDPSAQLHPVRPPRGPVPAGPVGTQPAAVREHCRRG